MASKQQRSTQQLEAIAQEYFEDAANRPYSILEICSLMGVDYDTLCRWEEGKNKRLATLARHTKQRIAAGWEKGELPAALASYLLKNYFGEASAQRPIEITVRVVGNEL